jgi:hypothetical protein
LGESGGNKLERPYAILEVLIQERYRGKTKDGKYPSLFCVYCLYLGCFSYILARELLLQAGGVVF